MRHRGRTLFNNRGLGGRFLALGLLVLLLSGSGFLGSGWGGGSGGTSRFLLGTAGSWFRGGRWRGAPEVGRHVRGGVKVVVDRLLQRKDNYYVQNMLTDCALLK